jgi:hypothetical protein
MKISKTTRAMRSRGWEKKTSRKEAAAVNRNEFKTGFENEDDERKNKVRSKHRRRTFRGQRARWPPWPARPATATDLIGIDLTSPLPPRGNGDRALYLLILLAHHFQICFLPFTSTPANQHVHHIFILLQANFVFFNFMRDRAASLRFGILYASYMVVFVESIELL